jgi:diguanylate cyclase (GGDEF)-like protein
MRSELIASRSRIRELEKRIKLLEHPTQEEQASVLTRPEFNREVSRMLAFNERYGGAASLIYINFENMENVINHNDKSLVNAAIREASNVILKCVRSSDVVGRLAVDEFGVLLGQCDNVNAWRKAEQLSRLLNETLTEIRGVRLGLKICYGAYTFREDQDIAAGLREAAKVMLKVGS